MNICLSVACQELLLKLEMQQEQMDPSPLLAGSALECTCEGTVTGEMQSMVLMTPLSKKAKLLSEKQSCNFRVASPQEHQATSSSLHSARLLCGWDGTIYPLFLFPHPRPQGNPIFQPRCTAHPPPTRKSPSHLCAFALAVCLA
jgi:hypothetical protein